MSQYGRSLVPGESGVGAIVSPDDVHDRTIRAQVHKVDAPNGFVTLVYESLPAGGKYATVAPLWMSFPDPKVGGPAWGRFMPQESDMLKVSFDYSDEPRIVGYDVIAAKKNIADGYSGWPQLREQYESCIAGTNDQRPQFAKFTTINPGEYDFMSSGGSYIYGNNAGKLYMAGGHVSITLLKGESKLVLDGLVQLHKSNDSELRFGQVRRAGADGTDAQLASDTNGTLKEFNVAIKTDTAKVPITTMKLGNVADDATITMSTNGAPLRYSLETNQDGVAAPTFSMHVDTAGNTELEANSAKLSMSYATAEISATTSTTISSPDIKLGGSSSSDPLILTNTYGPAEQEVITQLAAQVAALQAQVTAITVAITAYTAAVTAAYPPATAGGTAWTTALVPITAGLAAVTANVQAAATKFNAAYPTYLSKISKTS